MSERRAIKLFADAHVFDGPHQGTRRFLQGLYTELAKEPGLELYLAANDTEHLSNCFHSVKGRIHFLPYKSRTRYGRLIWEIPRMLRHHGIDFAHFQYISPFRQTCPYIVTTHDVIFDELPESYSLSYRLLKHWLYQRSASRAAVRTTVSETARQSVGRHLQLSVKSLELVPNGICPGMFQNISKQEARKYISERYGIEKYILLVSRVEPRKNHCLLVELFSNMQLARKGYHLVFIGSETHPVPELEAALGQIPAEESKSIHRLEQVPDADLAAWYRGAEIFVYPSFGEGFGIPPLEAAAMQTPVLCSNAGALGEFHFFGADHISPFDKEAFALRLKYWLQAPNDEGLLALRAPSGA
jgi:glycosyltransferase involved in cell wall biosynthesis